MANRYYGRRGRGYVKPLPGVSWFFDVIGSNSGGGIGCALGLVLSVYATLIMPKADRDALLGEVLGSALFGIPTAVLVLGFVGAVVGIIVSFATRKGAPITRWSRKLTDRGRIFLGTGDFDKAFALADKALRSGAVDFPGGHQLRGDIYLEKGDVDKAVEEYSKAIRRDPCGLEWYCDRGGAYLIKGDCGKALADFNEAVSLGAAARGLRFMGYIYRGKAYSIKGEADKAIADYSEALQINPYYLYGYYCRGDLYKELGEIDKAIADFSEAIKRAPPDGFYHGCRGGAYAAKGDYDKAFADFAEAIRSGPNRARWHFLRGAAYENLGDADSAAADFSTAVRLEPGSEEAASARDALRRLGVGPPRAETQSARKSRARADLDEFLANGRRYRDENRAWISFVGVRGV